MANCSICCEFIGNGTIAKSLGARKEVVDRNIADYIVKKLKAQGEEDGQKYYLPENNFLVRNDVISFCESCHKSLDRLINNPFESPLLTAVAYRSLKSRCNPIAIYNSYGLKQVFDEMYKSAEIEFLGYKTLKSMQENTSIRWQMIEDKYDAKTFVFPKSEKHHHVCATRYEDNLVLIENKSPQFYKELTNADVFYERVWNRFENTSDETLFAISIIPLENIVSYQLIGDVEHVAMVSGGGGRGGQPNLTGAAIGGMLFGGAGAIIGAQTGFCIDPIKSTITEFDSRVTMLNLKNAEGQVEIRELPYYYSEVFMKVIPEKEFNFLQANKNTEAPVQSQTAPTLNMVEEMKQLKELLDLNLITQEEFDAKRQQILKL